MSEEKIYYQKDQTKENRMEWILGLNKSGYAGCLPNGNIVDRREFPEAIPVQKNSLFEVAEPKEILTAEEQAKKEFQSIILGVDENNQHAYLEDDEANECVEICKSYFKKKVEIIDGAKIENLISSLNDYARNYEAYEYGLPLHDEHLKNLVLEVKKFLKNII